MQAAAAAGDIATIARIISGSSALTPTDFIQKTVGSILFLYYMYVDKLHVRPVDLDDWIDGMLYFDAKSYIMKRARAEAESKRGNKK